jgi:branched-subunit amino acid aminotransferase/4-amino-4-deoxychorismate lyase
MSAQLASVDGAIGATADATISITDEGLLRGDGVFEVARVYDGRPFAWEEHLQRMARSAGNLRLEIDLGAVAREVDALLAREPGFDGQLRVLVTRGGRRIAILEPVAEHKETVRLATVEYAPTRILDQVKSLSYGGNMLATRLAKERGGDEALLVTPHGRVLEAPTSSFFYVLDGALHTPPLDDHILDSITRRYVLGLSDASERITTSDDLATLSEAFLASTTREIQPVSAIDDRALEPGPRTALVAKAFAERVRA